MHHKIYNNAQKEITVPYKRWVFAYKCTHIAQEKKCVYYYYINIGIRIAYNETDTFLYFCEAAYICI